MIINIQDNLYKEVLIVVDEQQGIYKAARIAAISPSGEFVRITWEDYSEKTGYVQKERWLKSNDLLDVIVEVL